MRYIQSSDHLIGYTIVTLRKKGLLVDRTHRETIANRLELFYHSATVHDSGYDPLDSYTRAVTEITTRAAFWAIMDNLNIFLEDHPLVTYTYPKVTKEDREAREEILLMTRLPGVYLLYDNDSNLIYIGKSVDLYNRMVQSAEEHKADKFRTIHCSDHPGDVHWLEMYLISFLRPRDNRDGTKGSGLSIRVPKRYKKALEAELREIWQLSS